MDSAERQRRSGQALLTVKAPYSSKVAGICSPTSNVMELVLSIYRRIRSIYRRSKKWANRTRYGWAWTSTT